MKQMKPQKVIVTGLLIIWALLLIVVTLVHRGFWFPGSVQVFFAKAGGNGAAPVLVSVTRRYRAFPATENRKIIFSIEELIKGPSPEEQTAGLMSFVPSDSSVLGAELENGVLYLDFDEAIEAGGGIQDMRARLAQIVFTATRFSGVRKVRFLINGKKINRFSGEGITEVERPLGRADFPEFGGNDESKNTP